MKKTAVAAIAALTVTGASLAATSTADAQRGFRGHHGGYHGGYHGGGFRGGRGFGIGAGIATGLALGGLGYYGYNSYAGGCYLERRVVVDQWGRRFVHPVRVCS